ncbi:MAG: class I SAM-dependent methyltransferase [Thermoleophilaceae bacterium]|nr:class I SAM-dependent methyltransferase [Thermoleophilaceae bacterium]
MADKIYVDNSEATEAWNTVLFDRFRDYRHIFVEALKLFSDDALALEPPSAGDRVVDLGCGFGDTAQDLARIVGPYGSVTGIDAAERFIEQAIQEAAADGVENVDFRVADVQAEVPGGPYDYAFGRMGTMFFANPVAAMRNVREAVTPGGRLCMIVWRRKLDNPFMFRSEEIVDKYVAPQDPEDSDELTCGPGPFSMANADTTSAVLDAAGFEQIALRRVDVEIEFGSSVEEAVDAAFALGPAAETMRLAGDSAAELRPLIADDLRALAEELKRPDGVVAAPGSAWVVTARSAG